MTCNFTPDLLPASDCYLAQWRNPPSSGNGSGHWSWFSTLRISWITATMIWKSANKSAKPISMPLGSRGKGTERRYWTPSSDYANRVGLPFTSRSKKLCMRIKSVPSRRRIRIKRRTWVHIMTTRSLTRWCRVRRIRGRRQRTRAARRAPRTSSRAGRRRSLRAMHQAPLKAPTEAINKLAELQPRNRRSNTESTMMDTSRENEPLSRSLKYSSPQFWGIDWRRRTLLCRIKTRLTKHDRPKRKSVKNSGI